VTLPVFVARTLTSIWSETVIVYPVWNASEISIINVGESDSIGVGSDANKNVSVPPLVLLYTSQNMSKDVLTLDL